MAIIDSWYRWFPELLTRTYYRRVSVVRSGAIPATGPVFCVGLHRNGAVDGMVYKTAVPKATFLVSVQLLRNPIARIFFTGIPVTRSKDVGDRSENAASLARCVEHLRGGGTLFVLPEGTSDLGPRHLPFHSGAARILAAARAEGIQPAVIPFGIFYRCPDGFRSDVVVVVGHPFSDDITTALEDIGVNVDSAAALGRIERAAALRSGDDLAEYYPALKRLEPRADDPVLIDRSAKVDALIASRVLATERGVPVFSTRPMAWSIAWLAFQVPIVVAAAIANAGPLIAGWVAGRRFADARNTITLWRLLIGAPVAMLWVAGVSAAAIVGRSIWLVPAYAIITIAGLIVYPELLARWPRLKNAMAPPEARAAVEALRES
jgi:1-acyl-sn-glycerol-3-phosphate acyltransferase